MKMLFAKILTFFMVLPYRIFAGKRISIGRNFACCPRFIIKGPGKVVIGDNVNAWSFAPQGGVKLITQSKDAVIKIGLGTRLNGTTIFARKLVETGKDCMLSTAIIQDNDFHSKGYWTHHKDLSKPVDSREIKLGDRVFVGGEVVILKGVTIGNDAVVGLRCVVRKDVGPRQTVIGDPQVVIFES
ncbi:acyltransferase [Candidatus Dojkabacteria bacterium]|nr:acyltransferase [Candidatus Dojkabacteria bacterium]